jgi:hypothetical protein
MRFRGFGAALALFSVLAAPALAESGDGHNIVVSVLGGIGGSPDADPGDGFGNTGYQVEISVIREAGTLVGVRLGTLSLDDKEQFGPLREAALDYAVIGGEYLFNEDYYVSGVFLGIGAYRLGGDPIGAGKSDEETAIGGTLGLSGEFGMTRSLAIRIEVSGHYADLEPTQVFGMAHAGLSWRF